MTRPPNKITGPNAGGPRQFFNSDATGRPRRSVRSLACFTRMPVSIYRVTPEGQKNESIAWLCDGNWRLPDQAEALEAWLAENRATLKPGEYVADIGFTMREDASGGGAAIPPEMMRTMADLGMSLFLSEYPGENELLRYEDPG
jgi:hypothetical protein